MRPDRLADAKRTALHRASTPAATTIDQRSGWCWWISRNRTTERLDAQTSGNAAARRDESLMVGCSRLAGPTPRRESVIAYFLDVNASRRPGPKPYSSNGLESSAP